MLDIAITNKQFFNRNTGASYQAIKNLAFNIPAGEFTCIIGPSGCGKSTLLNIINGLDSDYEGTVKLANANKQHGIATMFQTPRLMPWLSVLDNVRLVLDNSPAAQQRAEHLLAAMDLGSVMHSYPNRLSGGMQRRVALARAFAINPQILLMDEPFVSLDVPVANRLRNMLIDLWQQAKATVVFVTHDMREALALADRLLFLSPGPGTIVLDININLARPRNPESASVLELYNSLLQQHPDLLAGLVQPEVTE